ncbi:hypothetical protein L596_012898 [Steinernema carpocapsae]|uniref:G-protein coupled receptors family 1 profile domain-containing protein n=1 Tax=Steinernema carpocapsae TaxID=34508 RepID=A0A4U5NZF0_STECR|nr:hypothetical protein L596_012898 [Steinernema carpocapsae]
MRPNRKTKMFDPSIICSENGSLILEDPVLSQTHRARYMGVFFLSLGFIFIPICSFVLSVFCRPSLIVNSCYKLLVITTFLDITNLVSAAFVCGFLALTNRTPCHGEVWILYYSCLSVALWLTYCSASEVLALNRLLVFVHPNLASILFDGNRCWLWIFFIIGYPVVTTLTNLDKTYVFVPSAGVVYDVEYNPMHVISNFVKMGFITISYLIVFYKIKKLKARAGPNNNEAGSSQVKISIQTLFIAALADICAFAYTFTSYIPESVGLSQYSGLIGQLAWILLHGRNTFLVVGQAWFSLGGTGIIYLCLNTSVREALRELTRKWLTRDIYKEDLTNIHMTNASSNLATHG